MPNAYGFGKETARRLADLVNPDGAVYVPGSVRKRKYREPVGGSTQTVKIGIAAATISAGGTGTVNIWRKNSGTGTLEDTGETVADVVLDWMHGGADVSAGKEVAIEYLADEDVWRILWAECEDAAAPSAFSSSNTQQSQSLTSDFTEVTGMVETYVSGDAIRAEAI